MRWVSGWVTGSCVGRQHEAETRGGGCWKKRTGIKGARDRGGGWNKREVRTERVIHLHQEGRIMKQRSWFAVLSLSEELKARAAAGEQTFFLVGVLMPRWVFITPFSTGDLYILVKIRSVLPRTWSLCFLILCIPSLDFSNDFFLLSACVERLRLFYSFYCINAHDCTYCKTSAAALNAQAFLNEWNSTGCK